MANTDYSKFFDLNALIAKIKEYLPSFNQNRFEKAFVFAENAHTGQMRKDGKTPYLAHPVETVKILTSIHADEDVLISAILHDVPEDTKRTMTELKREFGPDVAALVEGVTKLSKVHYQHDMPAREIESLKKLLLSSAKDLRIVLIKLADRLHNMRTLQYVEPVEKRIRISRETLEIYVPIANLLGIFILKEELEDLCFKHIFPQEYMSVETKIREMDKQYRKEGQVFVKSVEKVLARNGIEAKVVIVKRSLYRIYKTLSAHGKTIDDLQDRIAIRVVVDKQSHCYSAMGLIHGLYVPTPDRFKDYIANPKINGYQALHTIVFGPSGVITQIEIQCEEMLQEAKYGVANYFFSSNVKKGARVLNEDRRLAWFKRIVEIEKNQQLTENFIEDIKEDVLQDRIFVFTPRGDTVDLPKGATGVDFAYTIHGDVGDHATGIQIDGKLEPIITILKTGDVVRVITSEEAYPQLNWLSFAKTTLAKNKILNYYKKISQKQKIEEGHNVLQKEFDVNALGLIEKINLKALNKRLKENVGETVKNIEELCTAVSEGRFKILDIISYVKKNRGILNRLPKSKMNAVIKIVAKNKCGLVGEILDVIYRYVDDVGSINASLSRLSGMANIKLQLWVSDTEKLSHLFDELNHMDSIYGVYRIQSFGLLRLYAMSIVIAGLWVIYPYGLKLLMQTDIIEESPLMANLTTFLGFLILLYMLLYLKDVTKIYFPSTRDKKKFWPIALSIITTASIIVVVEFVELNIRIGWIMAFVVLFLVYGYFLVNYDFRES